MRALSWPDAFPHPDVALMKAMKESNPRAALKPRSNGARGARTP
jgi:3-methyladenine DNA glycosylase/8-oxoguanine DNA glycosylase